jgi:hypothetical protein
MNAAWHAARRAASALGGVLREAGYWQRRMAVLRLAPDRYLPDSDRPADTYAEFLARTHGPLIHEPSARARWAGRRVG